MIRTTIPLLTLILLFGACRAKPVSEADARELSAKALERYCEAEKLSPSSFKLTEIGPSGDFPWSITYESVDLKPAREVAVSIDKRGSLNLSVYIEGRDEGPGILPAKSSGG
jgi:hypothetical protein